MPAPSTMTFMDYFRGIQQQAYAAVLLKTEILKRLSRYVASFAPLCLYRLALSTQKMPSARS